MWRNKNTCQTDTPIKDQCWDIEPNLHKGIKSSTSVYFIYIGHNISELKKTDNLTQRRESLKFKREVWQCYGMMATFVLGTCSHSLWLCWFNSNKRLWTDPDSWLIVLQDLQFNYCKGQLSSVPGLDALVHTARAHTLYKCDVTAQRISTLIYFSPSHFP